MRKKSKFKSLFLSMVPGMGHIYMGLVSRGVIFLSAMISILFLSHFLSLPEFYYNRLQVFPVHRSLRELTDLFIPLIWLFSVIDNYIMTDKVLKLTYSSENESFDVNEYDKMMRDQNNKLITILLTIIPGAGHIYRREKNKGIQLLGVFFAVYLIYYFTGFEFLNLVIVLLWIYSFIDIIGLNNNSSTVTYSDNSDLINDINLANFKNKLPWLGGILIVLGIMLILNRVGAEFIDEKIFLTVKSYIQDGIISLILIGFGVKLLMGSNKKAEYEVEK